MANDIMANVPTLERQQASQRLQKLAAIVLTLLIVLFVAKVAQTLWSRADSRETDLATYFNGAVSLREGLPLYNRDMDLLRDGAFVNFIYPPILALLFVPFPTYAIAWWGWGLISLLCWLGALTLLMRELKGDLQQRIRGPWWPVLLGALINFPPLIAHLFWGQAQLLLLLVLSACWLYLRRERALAAGVLLGLAIALKLFPALLLLPLLMQRRWRSLAAAVATAGVALGLSFMMIGWEQSWFYFTKVLPMVDHSIVEYSIGNSSVARALRNGIGNTGLADGLSLLIRAAVLGVVAHGAYRARGDGARGLAMGMMTLVLVPPVVWEHYYVLMYLPLLDALARARRTSIGWHMLAFFLIATASLVYHVPTSLAFVAQLLPIAGALLLLACQYRSLSDPPAQPAPSASAAAEQP